MLTRLTPAQPAIRFGAVLAGDVGGRGRIGLRVYNEDAERELSDENTSDTVQWNFAGKTMDDPHRVGRTGGYCG